MSASIYHVPINQKKLIRGLTLAVLFLLCTHTLLVLYNYLIDETPWYLLQLFDVNEEHNLPTWFSGFNLLVATTFLWIIMRQKKQADDPMKGRWLALFAIFCFLSIDEIAGIHESINSVIEASWAYFGAVIALGLGIYFLSFLKSLPRASLIAFLAAGAIYVGGAVGMELIGEPLDGDSLAYNLVTMIEEGMEMFGIVLFTRALLQYMNGPGAALEVSVE